MNPLYRNDRPGEFPRSWYAATAEIPNERPPLQGDSTADVCIVGAGYTGLSAARHLAEKGFDVVVLDAHRAGFVHQDAMVVRSAADTTAIRAH